MTSELSESVSHGSVAGHAHNLEAGHRAGLKNVDASRTTLNVVLHEERIEEVYRRRFGAAVEAYNERQKRADRRIEDYLGKIRASKQEKPSYEMVVQVGNRLTNPATDPECREVSEAIYRDFLDEFRERFPRLDVATAVIHMDEATPHMHVEYVPWSNNNKRGLETKNSLRGACAQMGYDDVRKLNRALFEVLQECGRRHGVERADVGCTRAHLSVRDFKAMEEELAAEGYGYENDPRLIALLDEQQAALEQAADAIDGQREALEAIASVRLTLSGLREARQRIEEAIAASRALYGSDNPVRAALGSFKACLDAVPSLWRDCCKNSDKEGN